MGHSYMIPKIAWLPGGYDCRVVVPDDALAACLPGSGTILRWWRVLRDGDVVAEREERVEIENGTLVSDPPAPFEWRGDGAEWTGEGGFVEMGVRTADDRDTLASDRMPALYAVYWGQGRKSFVSCIQFKFADPRVIDQIATFGQFLDGYPVVHLDRARDLGESLCFVNPYMRPIVVDVMTQDGRKLPRIRVPAQAVRRVALDALLAPGEDAWMGQVQITATNRVVTYTVKHSLSDPGVFSTIEHMDPFRADPTHVPAFQRLRLAAGALAARGRALARRRRTGAPA